MSMVSRLKTFAKLLVLPRNTPFSCPICLQKDYLNRFPEPKDEIERSYFQYKCQMKLFGFWRSFLLNITSPFLLLFLFLRDIKPSKVATQSPCDALFISLGINENVIPLSLKSEFPHIVNINDMEQHHLDKNDKRFIRSIWKRYPFAFQFLLKIYLKVSMYSAWEKAYSPKALLVCSEYSFTSSAMTAYCRQSGLKHIDVMHGEKLFYIRDSFFEFDRCYVWDNFYRDLFIRMRAEERQFTTEVPPSLCFSNHSVDKEVDFTFYLGAEGERDIRILAKHCRNLRGKGYRVAVRPHPRYTSKALLGLFPEDILIENNDTIPIEVSVLRTSNVVSLYSTVLNQALNNGINIVIDDLTDVRKYQELKCRDFICLNQPHRLLSEIVKDGATA